MIRNNVDDNGKFTQKNAFRVPGVSFRGRSARGIYEARLLRNSADRVAATSARDESISLSRGEGGGGTRRFNRRTMMHNIIVVQGTVIGAHANMHSHVLRRRRRRRVHPSQDIARAIASAAPNARYRTAVITRPFRCSPRH